MSTELRDYELLDLIRVIFLVNQFTVDFGIMLRLETSDRAWRLMIKFAGSCTFIRGMCVKICKVLMRAQICFIAKPKTPAKKMLATSDPVRELSTIENALLTRVVAPIIINI